MTADAAAPPPERDPQWPGGVPLEATTPGVPFRHFHRPSVAKAARDAYVVMRPANAGGPTIGSTNLPTELVATHFVASGNLAQTASYFRLTHQQVWVAVWFEMAVDSRRRYHL